MGADPIRRPGEFEVTTAPWADEPVLLADVQVHKIELGRPLWMMPLAQTDDPDAILQEIEKEKELRKEQETKLGFSVDGGLAVSSQDEELAIDENRPMIVFDVDGSSEWATLVVARWTLGKNSWRTIRKSGFCWTVGRGWRASGIRLRRSSFRIRSSTLSERSWNCRILLTSTTSRLTSRPACRARETTRWNRLLAG
jgi:hypothetical protein